MNTAFAKEYVINELDLKIVLPNNLTVITAEEAPDEKDILRIKKYTGIPLEDLQQQMRDTKKYLWAFDFDNNISMVLSSSDKSATFNEIGDLKKYPDLWQDAHYQEALKAEYKRRFGGEATSISKYESKNAVYIVTGGIVDTDGKEASIQSYQTIKNGKLVDITSFGLAEDKKYISMLQNKVVNGMDYKKSLVDYAWLVEVAVSFTICVFVVLFLMRLISIKKFFDFNGSIGRKEYTRKLILAEICSGGAYFFLFLAVENRFNIILSIILGLVFMISVIYIFALMTKRIRDIALPIKLMFLVLVVNLITIYLGITEEYHVLQRGLLGMLHGFQIFLMFKEPEKTL